MAVDPDEPEYMQHYREVGNGPNDRPLSKSASWTTGDFRAYLDAYYRFVEDADRQIGRILSALRASGLSQNTLVIMTSDHGEGMGAHRWVEKAAFWEETAKVPLVVVGHGVRRRGATDVASLVSGLDILPTICDYTGIAPPPRMRGRSLRPAIDGSAFDRRFVVSELSQYGGEARQGRMLRTARYKYVVFDGGRRAEQLFNLDHDPGEIRNLASEAASKTVLHEHRQLLAKWVAETADDFVMVNSG
jgi:arylsulfatase A-like enzyme